MNKSILINTPISHIKGLKEILSEKNTLIMNEISDLKEIDYSKDVIAIFTNPNQLKYNINKNFIDLFPNLKVICTASTGTNHINKEDCLQRNIKIISITEERDTINKISSTAEHAFALTLAALRNIPNSFESVRSGGWSYLPYIGRQLSELTIGIIGYGRLGRFYSQYCDSFGSKILVYDPYKDVAHPRIKRVNSLNTIAKESDIISIHAHVTEETIHLLDNNFFEKTKKDVLIVNTSRGEIVDESSLVKRLKSYPLMKYATDVLEGEFTNHDSNELINLSKQISNQVIITPHIAGMTTEAQGIAYTRAANLLIEELKLINKV